MTNKKMIRVGIGFATGRRNFRSVLKTYIYNWKESGLVDNGNISLNLFVAYDLNYQNTKVRDFTDISPNLSGLIDGCLFIGKDTIAEEADRLVESGVAGKEEIRAIFGKGYAAQRNAVLYFAIRHGMDYLIFLDDDEYPVAVTNTRKTAIWGGQHVISTHLRHIKNADITHGHHCGYISPIPYIKFDERLDEQDFKAFIEAISNDIINWDKIRTVMENGGVTYADTSVLTTDAACEVPLVNNAKFISGANLCINLTDPARVQPFYNPPGARGEDTFLGTCLADRRVLRVPCYTFHDGFATYNHLLEGVLPIHLKFVSADSEKIIDRFYNACIGWIRYKPLLIYITQQELYQEKIDAIREKLQLTLPQICSCFGRREFVNILAELDRYDRDVRKHYHDFQRTRGIWAATMARAVE